MSKVPLYAPAFRDTDCKFVSPKLRWCLRKMELAIFLLSDLSACLDCPDGFHISRNPCRPINTHDPRLFLRGGGSLCARCPGSRPDEYS